MTWPAGWGRIVLDEIGSTNDEARRLAAAGEPGPLWVMARRQTAGRGRRGNTWRAPLGNLNATALFRPGLAPREAGLISFVSALAVADLVSTCCPGALVQTKWPNDALLEGRKVSGILLECEGRGPKVDWVISGIGVNLAAHPPADPQAAFPPGCLADFAPHATPPEAALEILAAAFVHWLGRLEAEGFSPLREAWLARAARLGEPIAARMPDGDLHGVFADLDADGALVLHTREGPRRIAAADVFFP